MDRDPLEYFPAEISEAYADQTWRPEQVVDLGEDRYLVLLVARARGHASGVPLEAQIGHLVTLRGDRAARLEAYVGWDAAREAAGVDA